METKVTYKDKIIVALDFADKAELVSFLNKFDFNSPAKPSFVKVGMELFYAEGADIVKYLKDLGLKIFLDLKLHDIPTTVYKSIQALANYDVDIINVHALGGSEMMSRAKEAILYKNLKIKLIAVTVLTSFDQVKLAKDLKINDAMDNMVLHLATQAKNSGLDGVVCSAQEAALLKANLGKDFMTVCPGIRLAGAANDDQQRIMTPEQAIANGADYLVIGRNITQAEDPKKFFLNSLS